MKVICNLNGTEINDPSNLRELSIELNYNRDSTEQALSVNDWEFGVMENSLPDGATILKNILNDKTGIGVIEGVSWVIDLDNERGKRYNLFNGYIDLWKAQYDNGKVIAPAVQSGNIDWLNDFADSFSFAYLYGQKKFGKEKFIPVPYVIVKKQDYFEIAMTLVTVFIISDKIKEQIIEIGQLAAGSANPLEMTSIPRLILKIVYLLLLFASLIPLIIRLISIIIPPTKFHNVMYVRDLFEIGCKYMNLTFKSSIIQTAPFNQMVIMPEKYALFEGNSGIFEGIAGDLKSKNEKEGFFKGTFGDFLRAMKEMFYAKIVINNGIMYFEPDTFRLGSNGITIPTRFDNKDKFELNYSDFYSTLTLSFLTDVNDRHTIQAYKGTSFQLTQSPKNINDIQRSLLRNLSQSQIPFALAKKKTEFTQIEKILLEFSTAIQISLDALIVGLNIAIIAINILIKIINSVLKALATIGIKIKLKIEPIKKIASPSIESSIKNRIGMLKMESDFVYVPKIFLIQESKTPINTKVHPLNQSVVNASYLFYKYHIYKSFISFNGSPTNQYILKENPSFPFSFEDYEKTRNNNAIFTEEGDHGELISLKFNPIAQTASCTYKVRKQYITNLKPIIYEPDGQ